MSSIRPRRDQPRRREAPQQDAGWWEWATTMLVSRCGGFCEKCHEPLTRGDMERHHRKRRRDGGDRLANLLLLHRRCHQWITEHPDEAKRHGWIVHPVDDVETVPVLIRGGYWFLDDYGLMTACPIGLDPDPWDC